VTRLRVGQPGYDYRWEREEISSLHHRVQTGCGVNSASYPLGAGSCFPREKRSGREADYAPPTSAEVKNAWNHYLRSHTPSWRGASLSTVRLHGLVLRFKHRNDFILSYTPCALTEHHAMEAY
jgi:hypothetical protein